MTRVIFNLKEEGKMKRSCVPSTVCIALTFKNISILRCQSEVSQHLATISDRGVNTNNSVCQSGSQFFLFVFHHMLFKFCGTLKRFVALYADKDPPSARLLLVELQLCDLAEVLAAAGAAVWLLVVVNELVAYQAGSHGKCHTALPTLVRPDSAVDGFVLCQVGGFRETLGAHGANKRTYSHVDFLVLHHAAGQSEGFPTVGTGEGSFPEMLPLVAFQGERFVEGLATVCAWERLVVGVHVPLVLSQIRGADKILSAGFTDVRFLARVCADVLAVIRGPDVRFVTKGTAVWSFPSVQTLVLLQRTLM